MFNIFNLDPEFFSLDISEDSVKFLDIEKSGDKIIGAQVKNLISQRPLIKDGNIIDEKALLGVLLKIREMTKKDYLAFALPEEKSFLQMIKIPKVEKSKIEDLVYYEVENYIPLSIKDVYVDFQKVESLAKQDLNHENILLVAVSRNFVNSFSQIVEKAGFRSFAFETESLAIVRALVPGQMTHNPLLIIDLGRVKSRFIIFSGDSVRFSSSVSVSSNDFTRKIAKEFNLGPKEAEAEKIKNGIEFQEVLHLEGTADGFKKEIITNKTIFNATRNCFMNLVNEIQGHLDYYYSHDFCENLPNENRKINEIILCGGGAYLKGLPEFLEKSFHMEVKLGDPLINFNSNDRKILSNYLGKDNSLFFTAVLGLTLRNLYSKT
jgi:type IV pilus assembly protein PilM